PADGRVAAARRLSAVRCRRGLQAAVAGGHARAVRLDQRATLAACRVGWRRRQGQPSRFPLPPAADPEGIPGSGDDASLAGDGGARIPPPANPWGRWGGPESAAGSVLPRDTNGPRADPGRSPDYLLRRRAREPSWLPHHGR